MKLGEVLHKYRKMSDLSMRELANVLGISAATLCRIERGEMMDGKTLAAILTWVTTPAEIRR